MSRSITRLAVAFLAVLSVAAVSAARAGDAPWTAKTSVGVTYIQRGDSFTWFVSQAGEAIHFSADKRYFFFTTRRGDLACDCNRFELKVFETARVREALAEGRTSVAPLRTLALSSRYHKGNEVSGLDQARWLNDGKTIGFLAAEGDAAPQVKTLDVVTGDVTAATNAAFGVIGFDAAGGSIVYRGVTERRTRTKLKTYPAVFIDPYDMGEITGFDTDDIVRVVASYKGGAAVEVAPSSGDETLLPFFVSPDGRYAIGARVVPLDQVPAPWRAYGVPEGEKPSSSATRVPYQYTLVDIRTGKWRPLVDAPTGASAGVFTATNALWSPDSRHVIVLNTALPLGEPGRAMSGYIIDYDVERGTWSVLETLAANDRSVTDIAWREPGKTIVVLKAQGFTGQRTEAKVIALSDDTPAQPAVGDDLSVAVREDLNTPPVVIASHQGKELRLTAEDPVVAAARRAKVELVTWKDRAGNSWTGGMTLPVRKGRAGKIPLVVQIYEFPEDRFLPDGISTTAFAMQPLAAKGIAVLQMSMPRGVVNEGPPFVEAVDSAVEMAAEKFGIDPSKVGLLGFSRSGGRTSYAITHPGRIKLAAALAADGGDANYTNYLNYAATYESIAKLVQVTLEAVNGGVFWTNKAAWMERAPGFNLERVETPYLITSSGPFAFLSGNEFYTGLQALKKPVELVMFPEGAHQLMLPKERLASMELTVDWMSFWLTGQTDPDPAKAAQYARWAKLRALQDAKP